MNLEYEPSMQSFFEWEQQRGVEGESPAVQLAVKVAVPTPYALGS